MAKAQAGQLASQHSAWSKAWCLLLSQQPSEKEEEWLCCGKQRENGEDVASSGYSRNTAGWKDCLKTSGYKWEQNQGSLLCWSQNDSYKAEWITLICTEILGLLGNSSYCASAITISAIPDWSDPCKNQKTDKTA